MADGRGAANHQGDGNGFAGGTVIQHGCTGDAGPGVQRRTARHHFPPGRAGASEPLLFWVGTVASTSRDTAETMGTIIIAKVNQQ